MSIDEVQFLIQKGKYETALHIIDMLEPSDELQGMILRSKILDSIGNYKDGLDIINNTLQLVNPELQLILYIQAAAVRSSILLRLDEQQQAEAQVDKAINMIKASGLVNEIEKIPTSADLYHVAGMLAWRRGDFSDALEFYQLSLFINEFNINTYRMAFTYNNSGDIFLYRGEYNKALSFYNRAMEIFENEGNDTDQALVLQNIGVVFKLMGRVEKGFEYLKRSYTTLMKLENDIQISYNLGYLIQHCLDTKDLDGAHKYHNELETISQNNPSKLIQLLTKTSKGLLLKHHKRLVDIVSAQQLLTEVYNDPHTPSTIRIHAMTGLSELLLRELKITQDTEVLTELTDLIQGLSKLAEKQHSFPLLIESLLLQHRLSLLQNQIKETYDIIEHALTISKTNNLTYYSQKIEEVRKELDDEIYRWNKTVNQNSPFIQRLENSRIEEYLEELSKIV
ncbi:MAG: tetratricopeptide repeat protein [Candidatus Kariarchaeaceae archaeon]|jgi:tetratricopeptide (TPR) repeat protein